MRFFEDPRYEVCTLITGTQMSKTDGVLDVMGWRLDTAPRPQLYVGPSKEFVCEQFEPRLMKLFDEAERLAPLVARGKRNKKTRKTVAGVSVRLAWAGSATSLASDQAGDVYIDEFDKMVGGVKGEGDPFTLAKARADTYADRKIAVTSTPKRGLLKTYRDKSSGLEFWAVAEPDEIESPIWAKWQSGTRHHWAWCCPHCGEWFIPRVRDLKYPEGATPAEARRNTWLVCPASGCVIEESAKAAMNAGGQFVAPGQWFNKAGVVEGDPPDSTNLSLWVSGLASPFLTWGERVEEILSANAMGDAEARQGATNKVGELWAPAAGEMLDWQVIANRREPYPADVMPDGAVHLTFGGDVQGNRIPYVIRAWGPRSTSWLVRQDELIGDTAEADIWNDLADLLTTTIGGHRIKIAFVDSGFRPGKKTALPVNRVYTFCRRFRRFAYPTKGSSKPLLKPLIKVKPDVTKRGDVHKYGLELIRLDTDYWKSFVHERLVWPNDEPGAFHIHEAATEDYCKQLVAEARVITNGKPVWEPVYKDNHFLDAEAMAAAAAYMLNVHRLVPGPRQPAPQNAVPNVPVVPAAPGDTPPAHIAQQTLDREAQLAALRQKWNRRR